MTKREFIDNIRKFADDIERGEFNIINPSENATIFGNKNYGQIWLKINEACTINVDLYHATEEERNNS